MRPYRRPAAMAAAARTRALAAAAAQDVLRWPDGEVSAATALRDALAAFARNTPGCDGCVALPTAAWVAQLAAEAMGQPDRWVQIRGNHEYGGPLELLACPESMAVLAVELGAWLSWSDTRGCDEIVLWTPEAGATVLPDHTGEIWGHMLSRWYADRDRAYGRALLGDLQDGWSADVAALAHAWDPNWVPTGSGAAAREVLAAAGTDRMALLLAGRVCDAPPMDDLTLSWDDTVHSLLSASAEAQDRALVVVRRETMAMLDAIGAIADRVRAAKASARP